MEKQRCKTWEKSFTCLLYTSFLTPATDMDVAFKGPKYFFDKTIYENRVFDSKGVADPQVEIQFGPNIKDLSLIHI